MKFAYANRLNLRAQSHGHEESANQSQLSRRHHKRRRISQSNSDSVLATSSRSIPLYVSELLSRLLEAAYQVPALDG